MLCRNGEIPSSNRKMGSSEKTGNNSFIRKKLNNKALTPAEAMLAYTPAKSTTPLKKPFLE